jgi:multiple sugar transport system permease protein
MLKALRITLLVLAAMLSILPLWIMGMGSLLPAQSLYQQQDLPLWVSSPSLEHYRTLFEKLPFFQYGLNSLGVALLTTLGAIFVSALAGYAVANPRFRQREIWFLLILLALMIPPQINLVPLFFLMKQLGWINTFTALIVPGLFSAYGTFLYRQWFATLPADLDQAALLDGCSLWQRFWHVALPLAAPATLNFGLLTFIGIWNSFLWPLVMLHDPTLRTLPMGLTFLKQSYREATPWPLLMAASTLTTIPLLGVFWLGHRSVLKGLSEGAVKE